MSLLDLIGSRSTLQTLTFSKLKVTAIAVEVLINSFKFNRNTIYFNQEWSSWIVDALQDPGVRSQLPMSMLEESTKTSNLQVS